MPSIDEQLEEMRHKIAAAETALRKHVVMLRDMLLTAIPPLLIEVANKTMDANPDVFEKLGRDGRRSVLQQVRNADAEVARIISTNLNGAFAEYIIIDVKEHAGKGSSQGAGINIFTKVHLKAMEPLATILRAAGVSIASGMGDDKNGWWTEYLFFMRGKLRNELETNTAFDDKMDELSILWFEFDKLKEAENGCPSNRDKQPR